MRPHPLLLAAALAFVLMHAARADVVYDQEAIADGESFRSVEWAAAGTTFYTGANAVSFDHVEWEGTYLGAQGPANDGFVMQIYATDRWGVPLANPLVSEWVANADRTPIGGATDAWGDPLYHYRADVTMPGPLAAGVWYLISIFNMDSPNWQWQTSSDLYLFGRYMYGATNNFHYTHVGAGGAWTIAYAFPTQGSSHGDEGALAFRLVEAPEPGQVLLAAVAGACLGAVRFARRFTPKETEPDHV
jgi:hypothetical protein